MNKRLYVIVVALGVTLAACGAGSEATTTTVAVATTTSEAEVPTTELVEELTIVGTAGAAGSFTTLLAAVEAGGLTETQRRGTVHRLRPYR